MAIRILFDLKSGFGLGDLVQSSILWKHLRKYRPHWQIDVRCPKGYHAAIAPFVHKVWDVEDTVDGEYESVQALGWTDCFETFADRPSTKVAFALKNVFGIEEYDPALGRYEVEFDEDVLSPPVDRPVVGLHHTGNSHPKEKNLPPEVVATIRKCVSDLRAFTANLDSFQGASKLASAISFCRAFVGIDSGPGKVASATETPTLICWTGHHPLRYHDPAPNTTHLIPDGWLESLPPFDELSRAESWGGVVKYFHENYRFRTYRPGQLAQEACRWLRETLK